MISSLLFPSQELFEMKELFYPLTSIIAAIVPILDNDGRDTSVRGIINTSYSYKEGYENVLNREYQFLTLWQ
jgi:hypothetical protein